MSVETINTHVEAALARLLEQYKKSPRLKSIVQALIEEIQTLEDTLHGIDLIRSIATATGKNLDRIGASIGVSRSSDTSDAIYRVLILGKITANVSQGETEAVITTYLLLTQASEVTLDEYFPAMIRIYSNGFVEASLAPYIEIYLKQAIAAGVSIDSFGIYAEDGPFGFAGNPAAIGFGDDADPAIGGKLGAELG